MPAVLFEVLFDTGNRQQSKLRRAGGSLEAE
jgi:hypothetical protein